MSDTTASYHLFTEIHKNIKASALSGNIPSVNGNELEGTEGVIVNYDKIKNFLEGSGCLAPAHETVHLAGKLDANKTICDIVRSETKIESLKKRIGEKKEIKIRAGDRFLSGEEYIKILKELEEDYKNKNLNAQPEKKDDKITKELSPTNEELVKKYFENKTD